MHKFNIDAYRAANVNFFKYDYFTTLGYKMSFQRIAIYIPILDERNVAI